MTADPLKEPGRKARCPICRTPTVAAFKPFCSKRCSDVDLARWLNGAYAIPGGIVDDDEDGAMAPEPPKADDGT